MLIPTPSRIRTVFAFAITGALACADSSPARLVPLSDPFVYNGTAAIGLPVQALTREGSPVAIALQATSDRPAVVEVADQRLQCLRAGDARVDVRAGALRAAFSVQCRPILSFGPPLQTDYMVLGGAPMPLNPVAYDSSGQRVTELRFSATSEDTSVVSIRAGLAVPRGVGSVRVRLDFGGIDTWTTIEVVAPVVRENVQLAEGEYRQWALGPGRYVARIESMRGGAGPAIVWRSANANCAFDPQSRATLHCVIADSGSVVAIARASADASILIDRRAR